MEAIIYLAQVSACLGAFYLFYYLLLSRLTFFTINRWYLVVTLILSFAIPTLNITLHQPETYPAIVNNIVYMNELQQINPNPTVITQTLAAPAQAFNWAGALKILYVTSVMLLFARLLMIIFTFFNKVRKKRSLQIGGVRIVQGAKDLDNGSFFNYIFLNDDELSDAEIQQIIAHEMLHVKLYHSADRVLIKIAQILLWFNPFVYLYARAIEENHEFEVDREIGNNGSKVAYAELLLHLSVARQGTLYHNFSMVPLKKRITMLFTKPTHKMKRVIYLLVVPVVLISCLAFAKLKTDRTNNKNDKATVQRADDIDTPKVKYRQRLKLTPEQRKESDENRAKAIAYMESAEGKKKMELAQSVQGKEITVTVLGDHSNKEGKFKGKMVKNKDTGEEFLLLSWYGQEKQLNNELKKGDEIKMRVFGAVINQEDPITITPAYVVKNGKEIFRLAEANKIPDYPFLYEANKVRFAEGQMSNITKYPNGKWKTAVFERVNGYKFNLTFKPTAPDMSSIKWGDHVMLRFIHEVKTGTKTYKINDWVSISTDIKDYGIKNPEWFGKFYEKADNKQRTGALKTIDTVRLSVIGLPEEVNGIKAVKIDGKDYPADLIYKIGSACIKTSDRSGGVLTITTKNGEITYQTPVDLANIKAEYAVKDKFYSRIRLKKDDGSTYYQVKLKRASGSWAMDNIESKDKVGVIINNKLYSESDFVKLFPEDNASYGNSVGVGRPSKTWPGGNFSSKGYNVIFRIGHMTPEDFFKGSRTGSNKKQLSNAQSATNIVGKSPASFINTDTNRTNQKKWFGFTATINKSRPVYKSWGSRANTYKSGNPPTFTGGSSDFRLTPGSIFNKAEKITPVDGKDGSTDGNSNTTDGVGKPSGAIYRQQNDSLIKSRFAGKILTVKDIMGMYLVIVKNGDYFAVYTNMSKIIVAVGQEITEGQLLGATAYRANADSGEGVFELYHGQKLLENTQEIEAVISSLTSPKLNMKYMPGKYYANNSRGGLTN